jgi:hypothetical protein
MATNLVLPQCEKGIRTQLSTPYRQVLGSLLHLANFSRPDISYSVGYLSRFAEAPTEAHWEAMERVVQYLDLTKSLGIQYRGAVPNPLSLTGYVDATWVGKRGLDPLSRSTSGYCFFFGGGLVSWKSAVQRRPALSSTDAEVIAASEGAREAVWLRHVLAELGHKQKTPTILHEDNKGCEDTVENGALREPLKHLLLREHYVLWAAQEQLIKLQHISTKDQIADIFTKPLSPQQHHELSRHFMA